MGMVDGAQAFIDQRNVGATGWSGQNYQTNADPAQANQAANLRLPGSSISCLNQTGMIHTPNSNYYITDGRWTQASIQAVGGMIDIVFDEDGAAAQINYGDRANSITIAVSQDGTAEVSGLKMDRYSMSASNEIMTPTAKQGYSENELLQAANLVWQQVPAMPPDQFIKNLIGNPQIQRLFGQFAQRVRMDLQQNNAKEQ
jgi:hypothetical protein